MLQQSDVSIRIDSPTGTVYTAGTLQSMGADFAEYYPNVGNYIIPDGTIVTRVGDSVRPVSNDLDAMLGVVSSTATMTGNGADMHWSGKYVMDHFGRPIKMNGEYVLNPSYRKSAYIPRSERPNEFTLVALMGQVFVRVDKHVKVNDCVDPRGRRSTIPTRLKVMRIEHPYDETKGYAVAFCMLFPKRRKM